jgi:outer membrane protein assembly factor BamB
MLFVVGLLVFVGGLIAFRSLYFPDGDVSDGEGNAHLHDDGRYPWPQWLGPRRDGVSPDTGMLASWPTHGPPQLWSISLGPGYSSMAIARGRLVTMTYHGGREFVVCLNADTGKDVWRRSYAASYAGQDRRFNTGPRSTPTVDGDRVYTVGAAGAFACWRLQDGEELWRHDLRERFEVDKSLDFGDSCSPLVVNELVYVNPGGKTGSVAAFHKITGELVWSARDDDSGYSSPIFIQAAGRDQVLFFNAQHLVSVAPDDGKTLWTLKWRTTYDLNVATPLFVDNDIFISSGYSKGCARLRVSADTAGKLKVSPVYQNKDLCNHFTNSVFHAGHIYGFNGHVNDFKTDGQFVCLDYATGAVRWKQAGPALGSIVVAEGRLIMYLENGQVVLALADPHKYQEISSFRFSTQRDKCWAAPAVANRKLYLRDADTLACFDLRQR